MSNGFLRKSLQEQKTSLMQGPLKKWTEHSHELHLLKIHSKGGLLLHPRAGWGLIFWTISFNNPKKFFLMRGPKIFWVHWNLFSKLLKHGHFGINFRFWLVWVSSEKAKVWVHWIFYEDMKNIQMGHALSFYMHRKITS